MALILHTDRKYFMDRVFVLVEMAALKDDVIRADIEAELLVDANPGCPMVLTALVDAFARSASGRGVAVEFGH